MTKVETAEEQDGDFQRRIALLKQQQASFASWLVTQLTGLALARQATVEPATFKLYVSKLARYDKRDIAVGIDTLSNTSRNEGETAFPDLPTIRRAIESASSHRKSREHRNAERERYETERRDRTEHPERYVAFADIIAEVMKRRGVDLRSNK